jgi:sarcosine oxidase delta subunit
LILLATNKLSLEKQENIMDYIKVLEKNTKAARNESWFSVEGCFRILPLTKYTASIFDGCFKYIEEII